MVKQKDKYVFQNYAGHFRVAHMVPDGFGALVYGRIKEFPTEREAIEYAKKMNEKKAGET